MKITFLSSYPRRAKIEITGSFASGGKFAFQGTLGNSFYKFSGEIFFQDAFLHFVLQETQLSSHLALKILNIFFKGSSCRIDAVKAEHCQDDRHQDEESKDSSSDKAPIHPRLDGGLVHLVPLLVVLHLHVLVQHGVGVLPVRPGDVQAVVDLLPGLPLVALQLRRATHLPCRGSAEY